MVKNQNRLSPYLGLDFYYIFKNHKVIDPLQLHIEFQNV